MHAISWDVKSVSRLDKLQNVNSVHECQYKALESYEDRRIYMYSGIPVHKLRVSLAIIELLPGDFLTWLKPLCL